MNNYEKPMKVTENNVDCSMLGNIHRRALTYDQIEEIKKRLARRRENLEKVRGYMDTYLQLR